MKQHVLCAALAGLLLVGVFSGCKKEEVEWVNYNNGGTRAVAPAPSSSSSQSETVEDGTVHGTLAGAPGDGHIEIKENLFIAQTNDIYLNYPEYLGWTIEYEGFFDYASWEEGGVTYYFVVRNGPGCCGFDDLAGFEVIWEDGSADYPERDAWVRVSGVLEVYNEGQGTFLRVRLTDLEELEVRGKDTVTN